MTAPGPVPSQVWAPASFRFRATQGNNCPGFAQFFCLPGSHSLKIFLERLLGSGTILGTQLRNAGKGYGMYMEGNSEI